MISRNTREQQTNNNVTSERGGVLVLVALLIFVMLSFIGLAIDLSIASSSQSKQQHLAGYAALAALESWLANPDDGLSLRQTNATEKARKILELEANELTVEPYTANGQPIEIEFGSGVGGGKISFGNWHFVDFAGCDVEDYSTAPCFESMAINDTNASQINAVRVELSLPQGSLFAPVIAKIFSADSVQIRSKSTASIVPRKGLFLADLSRSTYAATHIPIIDQPGDFSEYVYHLSGNQFAVNDAVNSSLISTCNPLGGGAPLPGLDNVYPSPCQATSSCQFILDPPSADNVWNCIMGHPTTGDAAFDSCSNDYRYLRSLQSDPNSFQTHIHFRDDFGCVIVNYEDEFGIAQTTHHLIDINIDRETSDGYYYGPEPLTSILDGIHSALVTFEDRKVAGDSVGIIGFDQGRLAVRRFPLTPPNEGDSDWELMKSVTATARVDDRPNPNQDLSQRLQRHFFPRANAFTDIKGVLISALNEFASNETAGMSQDFVVLITDGLSNCYEDGCFNTYSGHGQSLNEIFNIPVDDGSLEYLSQKFHNQGIAVHTVLVGASSGPHTLLRPSGLETGGCMDDEEARQYNVNFVDVSSEGANFPGTASNPLHSPNQFYNFSVATGGLWLPVRPPCADIGGGGSCEENVEQFLDQQCDENNTQPRVIVQNEKIDGEPYDYTDDVGRLTCDPGCREPVDQIKDAIERIMSENPYVLVE